MRRRAGFSEEQNSGFLLAGTSVAATCSGAFFLLLCCFSLSWAAQGTPDLIRIGTGGRSGVYYPIGKLIARGMTPQAPTGEVTAAGENGVPGYIGVAQNSAGSIDNARAVANGEIEAGLVQADIALWAWQNAGVFENDGKTAGLRAIASLYPEKFQIVVRRDAGIRNVEDLKGKRFSVDESGSGTLAAMRIVLAAHGMVEKDLQPVYLKPAFTYDKIENGELQGFAMMAGAPMGAVARLIPAGITLVPIPAEIGTAIASRHPHLVPATIPAGVYAGIPETETIQVHALLVVSEDLDELLAYRITAALWSRRTLSLLAEGHPQGGAITPATALVGISMPLHPGALRYYRQHLARFGGRLPQ